VNGEKEVRIFGQKYPVKARVVQIQGFSAHADRDELLQWLSGLKRPPKKLFVVHGELESAEHFADYVRSKTGWDVTVPAYQDQVILD
jgi:metallo-beta-lactamase family protein